MPIGLDVVIEALNDGRVRLTSGDWDIALSPPITPNSYISLAVEEAGALADANGTQWRVVRVDGENYLVTLDAQPNRLNFTVEDGVVVGVALG